MSPAPRLAWQALLALAGLAATVMLVVVWHVSGRRVHPRLVILYAPCTVATSSLSPYNPDVGFTPRLEAFSRDGLVFTRHQTEEGQSGIAFAALFSGSHADVHGVFDQPSALPDDVYLVAEAFRDDGYETFFWAGHPMASPEWNYAQGVERRNVFWTPQRGLRRAQAPPLGGEDPRFRRVLDRLQADPAYRAFVLADFTITHAPYDDHHVAAFCEAVPAECEGMSVDDVRANAKLFYGHFLGWVFAFEKTAERLSLTPAQVSAFVRAVDVLYKSNVHRLDALFGSILDQIDARGLRADSFVVFTADHGEILRGDAAGRRWTHGFALRAEDLLVPLLMRGPSVRPGRYDGVSRSIDVFPTMVGLAGLPSVAGRVAGVDLSAAIRGDAAPPALRAFSHTALQQVESQGPVLESVRQGPSRTDPAGMWIAARDGALAFKLVRVGEGHFRPHAYDWDRDPDETTDLFDASRPEHRAMVRAMVDYKRRLVSAYRRSKRGAAPAAPDRRREELLRSLGYIR